MTLTTATIHDVQAYWDARPCNVRHSPKSLGTREYFDEVEARKYLVEPHIHAFAQFERWKGKKVLEIGCGIGTDAVNFARAGAELVAVDLSAKSLEIARRRFEVYGLSGSFYRGSAERLSSFLAPEPFDLIYSFGAIHHTLRPERVVAEIEKYCGPHTELRIMLYSKWSWKVLWILMKHGRSGFWRAGPLVRAHSEAQADCPVTHYYSFQQVRDLLRHFRIIDLRKEHIFPYVVHQYVKYRYQRQWYFRWMPRRLFRLLERQFGWHTLVVAKPL